MLDLMGWVLVPLSFFRSERCSQQVSTREGRPPGTFPAPRLEAQPLRPYHRCPLLAQVCCRVSLKHLLLGEAPRRRLRIRMAKSGRSLAPRATKEAQQGSGGALRAVGGGCGVSGQQGAGGSGGGDSTAITSGTCKIRLSKPLL